MALIVETGAIVPDANSYVTRAALIAYAGDRGVLIADEAASDVFAIKATDFLETFRGAFIGREVEPGVQPLAWPRAGACVGYAVLPETAIPRGIIQAQLAAAVLVAQGVDLLPTTGAGASSEAFITKEQLGPIVTEYSEAVYLSQGTRPVTPQLTALIAPYLSGAAGPTFSYRK